MSIAHLSAFALEFIPWLAWSAAARTKRGRERSANRPSEREIVEVEAERFFSRTAPGLEPAKVIGVATGCRALEWTPETILRFQENEQRLALPRDPSARCLFLISFEWLSQIRFQDGVAWRDAVERVLAPGDGDSVARFQLRPSEGSRFQKDTPPKPPGWGRTFWFQSRSVITPFHYDTRHASVTQIHGRKRFLLVPAFEGLCYLEPFSAGSGKGGFASRIGLQTNDERELNFLGQADGVAYDVILEPGDTLHIPPYWWHHAECLDGSISMIQTKPLRFRERLHPLMARAIFDLYSTGFIRMLSARHDREVERSLPTGSSR